MTLASPLLFSSSSPALLVCLLVQFQCTPDSLCPLSFFSFSVCFSSNSRPFLSLLVVHSLISRLLLRGGEMNRGRENWSPSVTNSVNAVFKSGGLPRDQIDFSALNVCVPGNLLFWMGQPVSSRWDLFVTMNSNTHTDTHAHTCMRSHCKKLQSHKGNSHKCSSVFILSSCFSEARLSRDSKLDTEMDVGERNECENTHIQTHTDTRQKVR